MEPSFDPEAERDFVERVLAGSPEHREEFDRRMSCVPRFLAHRNRKMGHPFNTDEMNDLVNETYLVLWERLPSYRPLAPLESWIFGVCRVQFKHALRTRRKWRQGEPLPDDVPDPRARSVADTVADYGEAVAALERLGGIEADVLRLKHLEGLTFEEVGRRLGIPPNTAKTYHYRGLTRLRRMLGEGA